MQRFIFLVMNQVLLKLSTFVKCCVLYDKKNLILYDCLIVFLSSFDFIRIFFIFLWLWFSFFESYLGFWLLMMSWRIVYWLKAVSRPFEGFCNRGDYKGNRWGSIGLKSGSIGFSLSFKSLNIGIFRSIECLKEIDRV